MKSKVTIVMLLLSIVSSLGLYADNISAEKTIFPISLSFEGTDIFGLTFDEFKSYYSGAYNKPENYADLMFKRFRAKFETTFNKNVVGNAEYLNNCTGVLHIDNITEKAGYTGTLDFYNNETLSMSVPVKVQDGRYNEFEALLYENAEIGAASAAVEADKIYKSIAEYREYMEKEVAREIARANREAAKEADQQAKEIDKIERDNNFKIDENSKYDIEFNVFQVSAKGYRQLLYSYVKPGITMVECVAELKKLENTYKAQLKVRKEKQIRNSHDVSNSFLDCKIEVKSKILKPTDE